MDLIASGVGSLSDLVNRLRLDWLTSPEAKRQYLIDLLEFVLQFCFLAPVTELVGLVDAIRSSLLYTTYYIKSK